MKISLRAIGICVSSAVLAACGGQASMLPTQTAGTSPQFAPQTSQQSAVHRTAGPAGKFAAGSIFVGYGAGSKSYIEMYANADGKWAKIGTITDQVATPASMVADRDGKLYVADYASDAVSTYIDGKYAGSLTKGLGAPYGLAIDRFGDLAVTNTVPGSKAAQVTYYQHGNEDHLCVIQTGLEDPRDAAFSGSNLDHLNQKLWIADYAANAIAEWGLCDSHITSYTNAGIKQPVAVSVDHDGMGDLWAANAGANNVTEYDISNVLAASPIKTISTGDQQPTALLSHGEDLYIAAYGAKGSKVIDYNIKDGKQTEFTDGVNAPRALAWCEPNLCAMDAFGITIYDSSNKLVNTIKAKQTPLSLAAVPMPK